MSFHSLRQKALPKTTFQCDWLHRCDSTVKGILNTLRQVGLIPKQMYFHDRIYASMYMCTLY